MRFFFITDSPPLARFVTERGVSRVFIDLEILGKEERQGHLDTVISHHEIANVGLVRAEIPDHELMVRVNPVHRGSADEVEQVIDAGADIIMLPMFRTAEEVSAMVDLIDGRCKLCLLIETRAAMEGLASIAPIAGIDEFHIGLNDLSLELGLDFMFEPLALGLVDRMAKILEQTGKPFGIGGLARADEGLLPARLLIGEHVRLKSSAAILSRTFHRNCGTIEAIEQEMDFAAEIAKLIEIEQQYQLLSPDALAINRREVARLVGEIKANRRSGG